jgi:hypothetical protein
VTHFVTKCWACGKVLGTCRCPSLTKELRVSECNPPCEGAVRAQRPFILPETKGLWRSPPPVTGEQLTRAKVLELAARLHQNGLAPGTPVIAPDANVPELQSEGINAVPVSHFHDDEDDDNGNADGMGDD